MSGNANAGTCINDARLALRIDLLSGLAEKFAETGLLVSSKACSMAWPGLILFGLVYPA